MRCKHPRPIRTEHRGVQLLACLDCCEATFRDQRGETSPLTTLTEPEPAALKGLTLRKEIPRYDHPRRRSHASPMVLLCGLE